MKCTGRCLALALALVAPRFVHADAPEPIILPSAGVSTDVRMTSAVATNGFEAQAVGLWLDGRLAGPAGTDAFARASFVLAAALRHPDSAFDPQSYTDSSAALKLGGRARVTSGRVTAIASVWTSLVPGGLSQVTTNPFASRPDAFDDLLGLSDPYGTRYGIAMGGSLDLVVRTPCAFGQLEVGTALVHDERDGIVVDDLLVGAGAGGYVSRNLTLALEYRLVQEPTGPLASGATLQHLAVAIGNAAQTRRFRAGIGAGLVLGFDVTHPF